MKRVTLYSSSSRSRSAAAGPPDAAPADSPAAGSPVATVAVVPPSRTSTLFRRHRSLLFVCFGVLLTLLGVFIQAHWTSAPRQLTQADIDDAVRRSLVKKPLPSNAARAYEAIRGSVVRVRGFVTTKDRKSGEDKEFQEGVGTGVVIVDKGLILTNLHVVSGAERISLTFADGTESDAQIVGVRPQHDLAVLQAKTIPDDLVAATLRSTRDLRPGDDVVAVGFPFGFGPSASAGVISGLKREFRSPKGERTLTNLIQFDAAANPGNSGGPLVNSRGEVVGIVTAILNPTNEGFFVGLAFAVPIEEAAGAVGVSPF